MAWHSLGLILYEELQGGITPTRPSRRPPPIRQPYRED